MNADAPQSHHDDLEVSAPGACNTDELVGNYIRFHLNGCLKLTLTHEDAGKYDDFGTQSQLRQLLDQKAVATCLCKQGGVPSRFFEREGKCQVGAYRSADHACARYSKGAHAKGDRKGANRKSESGQIVCKARLPLAVIDAIAGDERTYGENVGATSGDDVYLSQQSLIRLGFEEAGWLHWDPARVRSPGERWSDMQAVVARMTVNEQQFSSNVTALGSDGTVDVGCVKDRLRQTATEKHIPLRYVLSQATRIVKLNGVTYLEVLGLPTPLALSPELVAKMLRSDYRCYCRLRATTGLGDSTVVVLAGLYLDRAGELAIHSATLHLASPELVPAESRQEARAISDAIRRGLKCWRSFNNVPGTDFQCDLVVESMGRLVYVEVWGIKNPEYDAQRVRKTAVYMALGLILAEWDAVRSRGVPNMLQLIYSAISNTLRYR